MQENDETMSGSRQRQPRLTELLRKEKPQCAQVRGFSCNLDCLASIKVFPGFMTVVDQSVLIISLEGTLRPSVPPQRSEHRLAPNTNREP